MIVPSRIDCVRDRPEDGLAVGAILDAHGNTGVGGIRFRHGVLCSACVHACTCMEELAAYAYAGGKTAILRNVNLVAAHAPRHIWVDRAGDPSQYEIRTSSGTSSHRGRRVRLIRSRGNRGERDPSIRFASEKNVPHILPDRESGQARSIKFSMHGGWLSRPEVHG